jgi:chorismate mutase/prephenate dehydratase
MTNTAISGKYIASKNQKENACIANMKTKEMYDLELLKQNINNEEENYTRFFVISNESIVIDGSDKISIVTSAKNESGALIELLQIFYKYGLNMVNLKSRPRVNKPWEYYFYIDFEGNMADENVKMALEEMREKSNYLQILGNYKLYNLKI